ncbi:MAG: CRISPR-associated endonuclease Cas1 [Methanolinea sp.]|jgi:CRISPR-associated endonuclease Cas1
MEEHKDISVPWYLVSGFGAHLKATSRTLVIQKNGQVEEIPLTKIRHLLVMGGHFVHSGVISRLLSSGACVSFFEADGEPLGILKPFGFHYDDLVREAQQKAFSHSYAMAITKGSLHSRIRALQRLEEDLGEALFYEGEFEIMEKSLAELEFLVRVEEVRRIHRLVTDMYYEILARTFPHELGFRRRSPRPHQDVVNTLLSFGYGLLFGNACVAAIGAHLDPDIGFLHRGKGGLVNDLIDPFKTEMVDIPISILVREGIPEDEYECGPARCTLSDELIHTVIGRIRESIRQDLIDNQVLALCDALLKKTEYVVRPCQGT